MGRDSILETYEQVAERYARERSQVLFEQAHLQTMLDAAPGLRVLDLGCGPGMPIAAWLAAEATPHQARSGGGPLSPVRSWLHAARFMNRAG